MSHMVFEYRFKLRLHDVDHAGAMFFARLFVHAHDAYESFMAHLGADLPGLIGGGTHLPVAHAAADYLSPMRHGDEIAVELAVERLGHTSFTVGYAFRGDGGACARVNTVHVFVDPRSGRPAPLPEGLRERLLPYCAASR